MSSSPQHDEYPNLFTGEPMSTHEHLRRMLDRYPDEYPDGFHTFNSLTLVAAYERSEPMPSAEIVDEYAAKYHEKCVRDQLIVYLYLRVGLEELVVELMKAAGVRIPSRDDIVEALAANSSDRWWDAIEERIDAQTGLEFGKQAEAIVLRALGR